MINTKPQILVVEDEKSLLKTWVKKFERQGFKVLTAVNSAKAFALAKLYRPDMVVVDIVMPGSDGLILIKKLKDNKWLNKIPVMFLSNWLISSTSCTVQWLCNSITTSLSDGKLMLARIGFIVL